MDSNTTLVKVKYILYYSFCETFPYSNTTLVKVKFAGLKRTDTTAKFKYNSC